MVNPIKSAVQDYVTTTITHKILGGGGDKQSKQPQQQHSSGGGIGGIFNQLSSTISSALNPNQQQPAQQQQMSGGYGGGNNGSGGYGGGGGGYPGYQQPPYGGQQQQYSAGYPPSAPQQQQPPYPGGYEYSGQAPPAAGPGGGYNIGFNVDPSYGPQQPQASAYAPYGGTGGGSSSSAPYPPSPQTGYPPASGGGYSGQQQPTTTTATPYPPSSAYDGGGQQQQQFGTGYGGYGGNGGGGYPPTQPFAPPAGNQQFGGGGNQSYGGGVAPAAAPAGWLPFSSGQQQQFPSSSITNHYNYNSSSSSSFLVPYASGGGGYYCSGAGANGFSGANGQFVGMATPSIRPNPSFNAQHTAELLRKAMKGFGCDKAKVIQALVNCNNAQRQEVIRVFKQMYGKELIKELRGELSGDFEDLIIALMEHPARYDAYQLRKAMQGLGTKEHVLIEIMTTRSNVQIQQIRQAYREMFGADLERDLIGETSGHFKRLLVALCSGARDESWQPDPLRANQDAHKLYRAGEGRLGTDESTFNAILAAQSYAQLRLVLEEYQKVSGHSIDQAINAEFSGDIRDGLLAMVKSIRNRPAFFAELLYNSMKGFGTRDNDLIRLVVSRSEIDLADIRNAYQRLYAQTLEQAIASDCSGAYKDGLIAIVKGFYH